MERENDVVSDELVGHIIEFGVRIVSVDFNLAQWSVFLEMRARSLQANSVAWYPWKYEMELAVRIDSCAIIIIGGTEFSRKVFDAAVLYIKGPNYRGRT